MSDLIALCMAGLDAQQRGNQGKAIEHFAELVRLAPETLDFRLMLAYAEGAAGRHANARGTLSATRGVERMDRADARRFADAAISLGADDVALRAVERALSFTPNDADLHAALGALHLRRGDCAAAASVLHRALLRWPRHVPTLMNNARLLADTGEYADALALYDQVLAQDATHAKARWYRGMLRLTIGDIHGGWRDAEARRALNEFASPVGADVAEWDGADPAGKAILLWGEQGLGDQIMGARFASVLAARGARVFLRVADELQSVLSTVAGVERVYSMREPLPVVDMHAPLLSVPALCEMSSDEDHDGSPYVRAPGEASASVKHLLTSCRNSSERRPRIGLVWAGSPLHLNDRNRSLPRELLADLLNCEGQEWMSLQLGERRADLELLPSFLRERVIDASVAITSFDDTAHLLASCDALVTVDTSVAHLAGAMGIPTLLMLPYVPDWRWQTSRRDTPWYGSMTLVRQPMAGAWPHVIAEVHRALVANGIGGTARRCAA